MHEEIARSTDPFAWVEPNDPKRKWPDSLIIESTKDMNQSFQEQEEVYNLLVNYRGAFSLRDEIDTCPTFEVELWVIDVSFFLQILSC